QFFWHTSDEEEDEEEEEEEKKEQEWTLERIKNYYDRGIHDHSECEEGGTTSNVKCNEDMLKQRPPPRPPSPPPPPPLVLWKIMLNMPSYIERRKRDPSVSFWSNISSSSKDSSEALIEEKL
ncbi:hypothetical protein Tco_0817369, partial [Tanacetum coccineum]